MHLQQAASLTIERLLAGRGSLSTLMPDFYPKISKNYHPKYKELCFGTCRWSIRLEVILNELTEKPIKESETRVKAIIFVGLYQLMSMRTPSHAVVNEAVESARRLNKSWARNLINAVLREYIRSGEKLTRQLFKDEYFKSSHPKWLLEKIQNLYPDYWETIIKTNNTHPPLCLRVNLNRIRRNDYLSMLTEKGIPATTGNLTPTSVFLLQAMSVNKIPGFKDGLVSIQDESAQLAAYLIAPEKGEKGLDACSAPGGKASHLLEIEPSCRLLLLDTVETRMDKIKSNFKRLQIYADMEVTDARQVDKWWDGRRFDFIMIDTPCSGSGVIRRNPDMRILLKSEQINELIQTQKELLESLWPCLANGGRLVYITCSLFPEENNEQIEKFSTTRGDVICEEIKLDKDIIPHEVHQNGIQLLPREDGGDGFFYSLLRKSE